MTQEFHISVTPIGNDEYLVRTERVAPGVPLAEEQVRWSVEDWLEQARQLMNDPLTGLLQGDSVSRIGGFGLPQKLEKSQGSASVQSLSLIDLGQQLYNGLFQGTLRDSWMTARGIAQHRGEVLRLRLGLKGVRLPRLPWEVMHGGTPSDKFRQHNPLNPTARPLATGTDIVFSRYQPSNGLTPSPVPVAIEPNQTLRILMVVAAPNDQERLELTQEANHLQQELRRQSATAEGIAVPFSDIQLTVLDQPGREELTQALEQGRYHVLHYAGHSNLGAAGGNLYLVNNKTGLTETLSGDDLAGLLVNNGIRMAVFNSCRGAYTAASDPEVESDRNLAEALVSRGIPAVLAMAEQIPDDVALTLTRLFYRNLKQGYPIDLSLSRARQGLISAYGSDQLYWALPILYLHPEFDGYLTAGDRSLDNPADRLLLLPQVYDTSLALAGEDLALQPPALDHDDWAELSEVVLAEEDLGDLVDDLEYDDEFTEPFDDEDLSYDEDVAVVSDLIQQLSYPADAIDSEPAASETTAQSADASLSTSETPIRPVTESVSASPAVTSHHQTDAATQEASGMVLAKADKADYADLQSADQADQQTFPDKNATVSRKPRHLWQQLTSPSRLMPLVGAASVLAIGLIGFSVADRLIRSQPSVDTLLSEEGGQLPGIAGADTPEVSDLNLATADTAIVTEVARSHLLKAELAEGQKAIAALLDRGALPEAKAALLSINAEDTDQPEVSFLLGRLAWQSVQLGNDDYSLDDARRYWETATKTRSPSPHHYNALGFAYYAEGNYEKATQSWLQALSLIEAQPAQATTSQVSNVEGEAASLSSSEQDGLTAYAGIALSLYKQASTQGSTWTASERNGLRSKAAKLYQMVMRSNASAFQPSELAMPKNWMWTEPAIADWQALSEAQ